MLESLFFLKSDWYWKPQTNQYKNFLVCLEFCVLRDKYRKKGSQDMYNDIGEKAMNSMCGTTSKIG